MFGLAGAGLKSAKPIDAHGREVMLGDWVRVLQVPLSVSDLPTESTDAFSRAVGSTFQVQAIYLNGDLELDMFPKISYDSIWIESVCCAVTRRPRQLSRKFQAVLDETIRYQAANGRPQYQVQP